MPRGFCARGTATVASAVDQCPVCRGAMRAGVHAVSKHLAPVPRLEPEIVAEKVRRGAETVERMLRPGITRFEAEPA